MIVRSIRLKNVKSYAEGPDGQGVTVLFEPGTNRVAGKNGHGKTTLIESLGYALFLTDPIFEESFQLDTYFLRAGKNEAEIDVTFGHQGEFFRIERGLGPHSKRKTKVIQLGDESTCAEGEREVSKFLCRLFNLPDPKRFSELFWKLVGVRQGRLAWPFDSKPGTAKDFFEPLLDVAVFRECFQSLKPAVDEFTARRHEQERIRARIEERIRERADSPAALEAKRLQLREIELRLQALNEAGQEISKRLAQLAALEKALRAAESMRNAARNALGLARQKREISEQRMRESAEAGQVVALVVSGYHTFEKAEKELQVLRAKQADLRHLEREIAEAEKKKIQVDGKFDAALSQTNVFARQKQQKEAERVNLSERIEMLRARLQASGPEFEKEKNLATRATRSLSDIRHFVSSLMVLLSHEETTLMQMKGIATALSSRDASAVETARRQAEAAGEALQFIRQQIAAANAEHASLLQQLQEIRGGICPFLKEQCRQFDPSRVETDLKEKSVTIEILEHQRGLAETAFRAALAEHELRCKEEENLAKKSSQLEQMAVELCRAFDRLAWKGTGESVSGLQQWIPPLRPMPEWTDPNANGFDAVGFDRRHHQNVDYLKDLEKWWQTTEQAVQKRISAVPEAERRRNSEQRDETNGSDHLRRIETEIENLAFEEKEQHEAASASRRESAELEKTIADLDLRRRHFDFLGEEISLLEQTQQKYRGDYQRYLGAKSMADEQSSREKELKVGREQERVAAEELRLSEIALAELSRGFEEAELIAARREYEGIQAASAKESANLENTRRETDREEARFREWQEACATRDEIDCVIERLAAAIKLTDLARIVLRDSAPMVAQQLCDRIAAQAQRIFNRINHDPVELRWEAAPRYSLRVIPGDRRFAMLSGGEQTKLALAMTLAMIQEFSGLRFCIFDEPTYGVDAESREKLGDALLESQKAADLEQLILVSHDDAFDGKIEHSIFLRKTAANGTEVVEFPRVVDSRESDNSLACGA